MTKSIKKVLIIVYDFPPYVGGGGVMRTVKYVKYLKQFGWEPIVLTVDRKDYYMPDNELFKEVQDITTYKCYHWFRGLSNPQMSSEVPGQSWKTRVKTVLKNTFVKDIKDGLEYGWVLTAVPKARQIIKEHGIDLIYSTSPPHVPHLVGRIVAKLADMPHIMDFRDGWVDNPIFRGKSLAKRIIDKYLEQMAVANACKIITTTDTLTNEIANRYKIEHKVVTISNGFDEEAFEGLKVEEPSDQFNITYVGGIRGIRSLQYLIEATDNISFSNEQIRINFVGYVDVEEKLRALGAPKGQIFNFVGSVSHRDALKHMISAHVLLIMLYPEEDGLRAIPGKAFEYLRAGKKVLALALPQGELGKFIKKHKLGYVVPPNDIKGIRDALNTLFALWQSGKFLTNNSSSEVDRFNRRELTCKLAKLFDEVVMSQK